MPKASKSPAFRRWSPTRSARRQSEWGVVQEAVLDFAADNWRAWTCLTEGCRLDVWRKRLQSPAEVVKLALRGESKRRKRVPIEWFEENIDPMWRSVVRGDSKEAVMSDATGQEARDSAPGSSESENFV
jgi:hypothetical protein